MKNFLNKEVLSILAALACIIVRGINVGGAGTSEKEKMVYYLVGD